MWPSDLPSAFMPVTVWFCQFILQNYVIVKLFYWWWWCMCVFHLQNGTVECESIFCPPPQCPPDTAPIYMPGACCKECQREYTHKHTRTKLRPCIYRGAFFFFTTFLLSPFVSCLLLYISIICLCYLSFHQNLLYNHASVLMTNWPHPCVARIPLPQMRMSTHTQRSHTLSLVSLIIQGQCAGCCVWVSRANVQKLIAVWLITRALFNTALW